MEKKNRNKGVQGKKKLEEAELTVIVFGKSDVVTASIQDCLAKGTKVAMADGTVRNVEDIVEGDMLVTFDHEAGCLAAKEVIYVYKGDGAKCAFTCRFENGAEVSFVGEHALFEQESCKYVVLTDDNAEEFIGRHFYSVEDQAYVELVSVAHETEAVEYYELYTKGCLNSVAGGMLNVADDVSHLLNCFAMDESLAADEKALAEDIQKYGIFEYNSRYGISREEYENWNMRYLCIAVGKGLISWERLWKQQFDYIDQRGGQGDFQCA